MMIYDILFTPVQNVNYCDGLGRCFRFVCIYASTCVFLCCYRFSVNKDLYIYCSYEGWKKP